MKKTEHRNIRKILIIIFIYILLFIPYLLYAPVLFLYPFELPYSPGMKTEEYIRARQAAIIHDSHYQASQMLIRRGHNSSLYGVKEMYFMYNGNPYIFYSYRENGKITNKSIIVDMDFNEYNIIHNAIREIKGFVFIVGDYLYYISGKGYERSGVLLTTTMHNHKVYYAIKFKKQLLLDKNSTEITISEDEYMEALNAFECN